FVEKMLSISLKYPNVLYCMDNETHVDPEWGAYWSAFIKQKAAEVGVSVYTTEMWDNHNILSSMHERTINHPEIYDFVDISQNNHQVGQTHYDRIISLRQKVADHPRPINNTKVYGGTGTYGTIHDGQERFWRNAFAGVASVRFHRE